MIWDICHISNDFNIAVGSWHWYRLHDWVMKNNQKFVKVGSTFANMGILDPPSASAEQL